MKKKLRRLAAVAILATACTVVAAPAALAETPTICYDIGVKGCIH